MLYRFSASCEVLSPRTQKEQNEAERATRRRWGKNNLINLHGLLSSPSSQRPAPFQEMEMINQDNALHEQFAEVTEQVRLANDNLEATRYAYFESPTNANLRRLESAQREYLIAVEDRESLAEHMSELKDWPHTEW